MSEVMQSILRSGNKGNSVSADITSSSVDANTQAIDVAVKNSPTVSVSNFPASQAVTGTFWQTTQPISGSVSVSNLPATQPVSGSVSVSNFPASQAVTGTFFQSTQPVSIASMPSTPVTGTFFQATQPVSGTVTATGPLTDTQLRASAVPVSGTFFQATQPVSGTVTANQGGTWTVEPGNTANTTAWKVDGSAVTQPVSGTVTSNLGTLPALTKGTQGSTGFSTQDLKDSGRNQANYYMAIQIVSTATDALLALTGYKSGALVAATTTPAVVTSGKTYRITSITLTYVTIVTTPGAIRFTLRANLSGVVAIGSPVVMNWTVGEPTGIAPVAGKFNTVTIPFPDGLEFAAGTGIGISQVGLNTVGTAAAVGYGIVSITGFEY